jgi:hypothetical protein
MSNLLPVVVHFANNIIKTLIIIKTRIIIKDPCSTVQLFEMFEGIVPYGYMNLMVPYRTVQNRTVFNVY